MWFLSPFYARELKLKDAGNVLLVTQHENKGSVDDD